MTEVTPGQKLHAAVEIPHGMIPTVHGNEITPMPAESAFSDDEQEVALAQQHEQVERSLSVSCSVQCVRAVIEHCWMKESGCFALKCISGDWLVSAHPTTTCLVTVCAGVSNWVESTLSRHLAQQAK